jgi:hypothetical protein
MFAGEVVRVIMSSSEGKGRVNWHMHVPMVLL